MRVMEGMEGEGEGEGSPVSRSQPVAVPPRAGDRQPPGGVLSIGQRGKDNYNNYLLLFHYN